MRLRLVLGLLPMLAIWGLTAPAAAQLDAPPGPVGGVPAKLPEIKLPDLTELGVAVPRPIKAATAVLGMGRQRLALVVGVGTIGSKQVLDTAARDTRAVAEALGRVGFVVMRREDLGAADLRASLQEFHDRLQPGGVGFVYLTGLGAQIDGRNFFLVRDTALDPALAPDARLAQLRSTGVALSEVVDALMSTPDSPRMLVIDAAYRHPALAGLPASGLGEQKLPPGTMALFGNALNDAQEVPAAAPLPEPAPRDPREIAATRFARVLVGSLTTPRTNGPEALRATRRAIFDGSMGQADPWLAGDTDSKEEFGEATVLDAMIPQSPEDLAREGARQLARVVMRPSGPSAGEQSVAEVLQQTSSPPPAPAPGSPPEQADQPPSQTSVHAPELGPSNGVAGALGDAAQAVGTAAGVAKGAVAVAAAARVAQAAVVASSTGTALGAVGSAAEGAGNMAAHALSSGGGEQTARAATRMASAQASTPPLPTIAAAPVAPAPAPIIATAPAAAPAPAPALLPATAPQAATPTAPLLLDPPGAGPLTAAPTLPAAAPVQRVAANTPKPLAGEPVPPSQSRQPPATDGRTTRNPEGGERPVYLPRKNAFGYAEGDTYTYQVIDAWKDEVKGRYTTAIDEVLDDGQMLANGHQVEMDAQGRFKKLAGPDGSVSKFEPSQDLWWANPKRGERRSVKFKETFERSDRLHGETEWKGSTRVGKPRKIELPAGEFEVLPIESSGWYYEALANGARTSGQWSRTVWYSPKLGHPVAIDIEDADRLGKLLRRERVELLHAQSARSTP